MTISQSNILGVATGTVDRTPNAKIWNGSAWVNLVFDTTGATSTNRSNTSSTIGPELAFAEAAAAYHGRTVYIIKDATGSTSLDSLTDWRATNTPTQGTLLAASLTSIANALAALTAAGIKYEVKGGMSMIGETEAGVSASIANRHGWNYQNAIKKVRDAVGLPYMRWVIGRPYDNGAAGMTYMSNIRTAEAKLVGTGATVYPENITLLDTDGFARTASNVHMTETGYNDFGTALFNAVKVVPAAVSAFNYSQLYMVGAMYRSDVASSITKDGSNDVSRWNDQTVAGWDMGQSGTASAKPDYNATGFGGIPSIYFNGSSTCMSTGTLVGDASAGSYLLQSGADNKFSLAYVIVPQSSTFGIVAGKYGGASGAKAFYAQLDTLKPSANANFDTSGTNRRGQEGSSSLTSGTRYSVIVSYDGSVDSNDGADRFKIYVNGSAVSTAAFSNNGTLGDIQTTNFAPLALGAAVFTGETAISNYAKCDLQFFTVFGEACDATRASQIHAKLAADFGL